MDDGTLDDGKLSKNIFKFDERWERKTVALTVVITILFIINLFEGLYVYIYIYVWKRFGGTMGVHRSVSVISIG